MGVLRLLLGLEGQAVRLRQMDAFLLLCVLCFDVTAADAV